MLSSSSQLSQNRESLVDAAAGVNMQVTCLTFNNTTTERVYLQTSNCSYIKSSS